MPKLITDWVKVAESGSTIDGRTIESTWLTDAAKLYSKETYPAVITLEHYSPEWAGNYGTVEELKTEKNGEVVSLFARLCPNENLIRLNRAGQKLFTSIKLHPNFRKTDQCYLLQIGVTDEPASAGVSQLQFRANQGEQIVPGLVIENLSFLSSNNDESLLDKLKSLIFSVSTEADSEDEEDHMKPEEMEKLTTAVSSAVAESLATAFKAQKEETKKQLGSEPKEELEVTVEAFSNQKKVLEQTQIDLDAITKKFRALEERIEAIVDPTDPNSVESGGAANDEKQFI